MTDPDERTINRAIAYVGDKTCKPSELQDIREEARAALHRLFRDRRRLENEVARLSEEKAANRADWDKVMAKNVRLREENARLVDRHNRESHGTASHEAMAYDQLEAENARLSNVITKDTETIARLRYELSVADYPGKQALVEELTRLREGRWTDEERKLFLFEATKASYAEGVRAGCEELSIHAADMSVELEEKDAELAKLREERDRYRYIAMQQADPVPGLAENDALRAENDRLRERWLACLRTIGATETEIQQWEGYDVNVSLVDNVAALLGALAEEVDSG